jgi:hypothetical protein
MSTYTILPKDDSNLGVTVISDDQSQVIVVDSATQQVTVTENVISVSVTPGLIGSLTVDSVNGKTGLVVLNADDISETSDPAGNKYYTASRDTAQFNIDLALKTTDDLTEGSTNEYYTDAKARAALTGAGDINYNQTTGIISFDSSSLVTSVNGQDGAVVLSTSNITEGSNKYWTQVRFDDALHASDTDDLDEGNVNLYYTDVRAQTVITANTEQFIKANSTETLTNKSGNISQWQNDSDYVTHVNGIEGPSAVLDTDNIQEDTSPTNKWFTEARARASVSVNDTGGDGSLSYDNTTGVFTFTGPAPSDVRVLLSANDAGGDGSFSYDNTTGIFSYTGPSATEVRAHFSEGDGIDINAGVISIETDGVDSTHIDFGTGANQVSTADLPENTNLYYTDNRADARVDLQTGANLDLSFADTDDLAEGPTNLYYTDSRARLSLTVTDNGGDGSITYNSATGVIDYIGPNQTEVRAHITKAFVDALGIQATSVDADSVALGTDTTGDYVKTIAGTPNKIEVSGSGTEGRPVTLTLPSTVQVAQDLTVGGNLTVNGDLTYLNTTDLQIQDNLFELNSGLTGTPTNDSGMLIQRGNQTNQIFMWDESVDKFTLGATASEDGARGNINVTVGTLVANIEGDLTGDVVGNVVGNVTGDTTGHHYGESTGDVAGDVTGDLTGDVTGDLVGSTSGTHTGPVVGNVTGDVTGDVTGTLNGPSNGTHTGQVNGSTVTASGGFTGTLVGNVTGDVTGNVTGDLTGDVQGKITSTGTGAQKSVFTEVDINGGTIDNTPIGGNVASTGEFTTVSTTGGITANTGFTGNLTGDVTGDVTGNVTGDVTGNVTGNVTGTSGTTTSLSNHDTNDLTQGTTNKYYATSLFNTDLATKTTTDLTEGTNKYYTDAQVDTRISNTSIDGLSDVDTSTTAPVTAQVLEWDGNNWIPGDSGIGDVTQTGAQTLSNKTLTSPIIDEIEYSSSAADTGPVIKDYNNVSRLTLEVDTGSAPQLSKTTLSALRTNIQHPNTVPPTVWSYSDHYWNNLSFNDNAQIIKNLTPFNLPAPYTADPEVYTNFSDNGNHSSSLILKGDAANMGTTGGSFYPNRIISKERSTTSLGRLDIDASDITFYDNTYKFPNTDGQSGEVLYTDGNGNINWTPAVGTVSSVNGEIGTVVLNTDHVDEVTNPTNKYFTDQRVDERLNDIELDEIGDVVYESAPSDGDVLLWDAGIGQTGSWRPNTVTGTGTVTSITAGDHLAVVGGGNSITGAGTLKVETGGANGIIITDGSNRYPALDGSQITNIPDSGVQSITTSTGLTSNVNPITTTGTIAVDVGVGPNQIVQLDSNGILPSLNGSQLQGMYDNGDVDTHLNSSTALTNEVLSWNGTDYDWVAQTGGVTSVDSGTGLTGGPITSSGTLNVDVGTGANQIVQLDSSSRLPAVDGSLLTGLPAGYDNADVDTHLNTSTAATNEVLGWNGTDYDWVANGVGDVTLTGTQTLTNKTLTDPILEKITTTNGLLAIETDYAAAGWSSYNGTIKLENYANTAANQINVLALKTNGNTEFVRFSAQGSTDDSTLNSDLRLRGASNTIRSTATNSNTGNPLTFHGSSISMYGNYTMPVTDGTQDQVMSTDGNGLVTFEDPGLPTTGGTLTGDINMSDNDITNIKSLAIVDTVGSNADMILTQDSGTANAIEIKADKAAAGKRSSLWWNYDDNGTKEYVGQLMWQADGGAATGTGDHYFRIASYTSGLYSDVIFDSWKNNYTRISNGFHTSGNAPIGFLELTQDKVNSNMRLDIQNGRTNSGSGLSPHALYCETDMSQDTNIDIMNSATFNVDYQGQTKLDGIQNTISFGINNTADGYSSVGKMSAVYNADGLNNKFALQSTNEAGSGANTLQGGSVVGSGNGKADITCLAFSTNVPYQMPKYSVAQLATLTAGEGMQVYCTDGDGGNSCLAVYDGTNWKRVALGANISTTP